MAVKTIITEPNQLLRQVSNNVKKIGKEEQRLMDDMLETMYEDGGIGLAANQVASLNRVLVLDLQQDDDSGSSDIYPLYMANPEILNASDEMEEAEEGCLSLPEQKILISRHENIKVKYLDYNNKLQEIEAFGWLARAIQHEIDHLDGKLLIDHLSNLKKSVAIRKLTKIKKLSA